MEAEVDHASIASRAALASRSYGAFGSLRIRPCFKLVVVDPGKSGYATGVIILLYLLNPGGRVRYALKVELFCGCRRWLLEYVVRHWFCKLLTLLSRVS